MRHGRDGKRHGAKERRRPAEKGRKEAADRHRDHSGGARRRLFGPLRLRRLPEVFFPNTTINEVDVAGCTVAQAAERLRAELPGRQVEFYLPSPDKTGDGVSAPEGDTLYDEVPAATVTYRDLGVTEDLDYENDAQTVLDLCQTQRGFFSRGWEYLACLVGAHGARGIAPEPEEDIFQSQMEQLSGQFSKEPQDTAYTVDENGLQVTLAQNGLAVSADALGGGHEALFQQCHRRGSRPDLCGRRPDPLRQDHDRSGDPRRRLRRCEKRRV